MEIRRYKDKSKCIFFDKLQSQELYNFANFNDTITNISKKYDSINNELNKNFKRIFNNLNEIKLLLYDVSSNENKDYSYRYICNNIEALNKHLFDLEINFKSSIKTKHEEYLYLLEIKDNYNNKLLNNQKQNNLNTSFKITNGSNKCLKKINKENTDEINSSHFNNKELLDTIKNKNDNSKTQVSNVSITINKDNIEGYNHENQTLIIHNNKIKTNNSDEINNILNEDLLINKFLDNFKNYETIKNNIDVDINNISKQNTNTNCKIDVINNNNNTNNYTQYNNDFKENEKNINKNLLNYFLNEKEENTNKLFNAKINIVNNNNKKNLNKESTYTYKNKLNPFSKAKIKNIVNSTEISSKGTFNYNFKSIMESKITNKKISKKKA